VEGADNEGPPTPDPERVAALYAPQFEACERLVRTSWKNRPDGVTVDGPEDVRIVCSQQLGRATQTYLAVIRLCRAGLPEQALMLCRSLYEDLIATHWALLDENRAKVVDRVKRQERHWDELYERKVIGFTGEAPSKDALTEDEWDELDSEFAGGRRVGLVD